MSLISPALAGSLLLVPPGKPLGNRERLYSQAGVCDKDQGSNSRAFFFLLQGFKRVGWLMRLGLCRVSGGLLVLMNFSSLFNLASGGFARSLDWTD